MEKKIFVILEEINEEILPYTGTDMVGDGLLDSLKIISLIGTLEDEFDIEINAEYITVENFANKESVVRLVSELANK